MATGDNSINICSRALNSIGAEGITSFEEGTTEARVAQAKYQTAKKDLLSIYPWTFGKGETFLARIVSDNLSRYKYLYEKPEDFLRAITVKEDDHVVPYTFRRGKINTDASTPVLVYLYDAPEEDMPAYFISLLIDRLARDFVIPVTGKNDDYAIYDKIYQNSFALAKSSDALSKTPERIVNFPLLAVRG